MSAALDAARTAKREVAARGEVRFKCRRGVHGDVIVYVEPDCKAQPAAWCCGLTMKRAGVTTTVYCFIDQWHDNPDAWVINDRRIDTSLPVDGDCTVVAVADHELITSHYSSSEAWAKHDIGLTSERQHDIYRQRFPDGYELVWGTPDPLVEVST